MKFSLVLLIATVLIAPTIQVTIPECIKQRINDILAEPVWNPPATISKFSYRGQNTYLISSDCCDQFSNLYDESCNRICAPSGGFTGRGDGNCMDFFREAKALEKVWSDKRSMKF